MIAVVAPEWANHEERADHPFHDSPSVRSVHGLTLALWTNFRFAEMYETHVTILNCAGQGIYSKPEMWDIRETLYAITRK